MEKEHLLLETYRIYMDSKERFISRSFSTNKFYLVLNIVILALVIFCDTKCHNTLFLVIFSGLGMLVSLLWWFNQDSYDYLIKVKYRDVIEKMEEHLPFAPCTEEFKAAREEAKKKKVFVFSYAHKLFAFIMTLLYMSFFVINIGPYISAIFGVEVV